jgi:hypothetical protein
MVSMTRTVSAVALVAIALLLGYLAYDRHRARVEQEARERNADVRATADEIRASLREREARARARIDAAQDAAGRTQ